MKNLPRPYLLLAIALTISACTGLAWWQQNPAAVSMRESAKAYLETLNEDQQKSGVLPYDTPRRVQWHFVPKADRKGLMIGDMQASQQQAAHSLLQSALSQTGYDKACGVMELEKVLKAFQKVGRGPIRNHERYYFTVFGDPATDASWGLSVEGHHLSMNFAVQDDRVVAHSPMFLGANPASVHGDSSTVLPDGTKILAAEESIAFEIVQSLSAEQRAIAVVADKAPRDIRGPGQPQPPHDEPAGIRVSKLNAHQQSLVDSLIATYFQNLPVESSSRQLNTIRDAGMNEVYFAWSGATRPGIGHYYLLEGPGFQIEFANTQPDAMGNPASHIHCVLRDPHGDFGIPIE